MTTSYDCSDEAQRREGIAHAHRAITAKQCVVIPTDTVYGIAADAFSPQAVATLLASKGRGRSMPPPVLIPRLQTMDGLAANVNEDARRLAEEFWPGGLTLIVHAQPSLTWDLGETFGTVAVRVPDDPVALDLLLLTGPLAVSSANRTGQPAAATAAEARAQLAESVEVYLDAGPRSAGGDEQASASTIVDATSETLRVVREGAISLERLRQVVPGIAAADDATDDDVDDDDGIADVDDGSDTDAADDDGASDDGDDAAPADPDDAGADSRPTAAGPADAQQQPEQL